MKNGIEPVLIKSLDDLGIIPSRFADCGITDKSTAEVVESLIKTHGDEAAEMIIQHGDDAVKIISNYGDDGLTAIYVYGNEAIDVINNYADDAISAINNGIEPNTIKLFNSYGVTPDILVASKNQAADVFKLNSQISDAILKMDKDLRPNPSSYLPDAYIAKHLEQFDSGISVIQSEWAFGRRSEINGFVGVPDDNTLFVLPKDYCDKVVLKANGNISIIENELGFPNGYFSDGGGLVRIDIDDISGLNLRMPNGNETGANSLWLPGGYMSGNVPEAITDIIPLDRTKITRIGIN